eukprot:6201576-Pleurochrysis_carterae.AAC.1
MSPPYQQANRKRPDIYRRGRLGGCLPEPLRWQLLRKLHKSYRRQTRCNTPAASLGVCAAVRAAVVRAAHCNEFVALLGRVISTK